MKTELKTYTVEKICEGFVYNELEGKGLFGLAGKLTIQPEYQRNESSESGAPPPKPKPLPPRGPTPPSQYIPIT